MSIPNGALIPTDWAGKKIFTTGEAAQVCKVSQQTIIRCFDSGRLTGFRVPGSKFRRIPRDELLRFMKTNDIPTTPLETGAKKRILIVDDDPQIVALLADVFAGDSRLELRSASTGYDAGLLTESFRPHLIVLDYLLPDLNGSIVCQRIRANTELADIKVVFVSGVVKQEDVQSLMAAGANDFIKKPFDLDEFGRRIRTLLQLAPARV